jgi:transposase
MRRVSCRDCGVKVEEVPWAIGKHTHTRAYMLHLAHWARKLSWKETALSFGTTWDHVCRAVEYVVQWGLEHRELGSVRAIGVDEIQWGRGHDYLTLVYQIEADCVRLLWVGKERTKESFEQFFRLIGQELAAKIEFVCSDMWQPYLDLIAKHCPGAQHSRSLPCRGQAQPRARRGSGLRGSSNGPRGPSSRCSRRSAGVCSSGLRT